MKQIVVLGTDLDTAMAYGVQHGASQMYFTFIGDENAEENIMRNEDRSKQLEMAIYLYAYLTRDRKDD